MTSFGWKRKSGENVSRGTVSAFENDAKDEDDVSEINSGEVDWLSLAPKRRAVQLEDAQSKSQRLKQEAEILAEAERYWEALKKLEEATHLMPKNELLHELKAQAYMSLNEVYPAISAATKAVELNPLWYVAHQTLGRAHINLGEVRTALKCFSRAIHLNPADKELWTEDLQWALELVQRKNKLKEEMEKELNEESGGAKIVELNEDDSSRSVIPYKGKQGSLDTKLLHMTETKISKVKPELKHLPGDYVLMRD